MNMNTKTGINSLKEIFQSKDFQEEVEFETGMLSLAFLNAIEKEAKIQGYNRKELAKKVGTSASYMTQIFRGNKIPNLRILVALGLALNKKFNAVPVDDIQASRKLSLEEYNSGRKFDSSRVKSLHVCHRKFDKDKQEIPKFCKAL